MTGNESIQLALVVCVLAPLAIAAALIAVRRALRPPATQVPREVSDRLTRIEQSIEAVASVDLQR